MNPNYFFSLLMIVAICFPAFKDYARSKKDEECLMTRISSKLFDFNTFDLQLGSGLDKKDFKVINQNNAKVIYENGRSRKGIKNDYGHRIFEVFYKGERLFETGHFIQNSWITNDYVLRLEKKDGEITSNLKISGSQASYNDYYVE